MLFRQHKGSLAESMETLVKVDTLEDIIKVSPFTEFGYILNLNIEHYCYDDRIDWDTYIITDERYGVIGFTNGEVK